MIYFIRKNQSFRWTDACKKVFKLLKKKITIAPVLKHFDRTKEVILEIDSSDYVNGGVLSQYRDNGILYLVVFYSKNMVSAECNYEIYNKELLAIIRCLKYWRSELESTDILIKVFTDHRNLKYFMIIKALSRRQAR
jgi:hypothetical protein